MKRFLLAAAVCCALPAAAAPASNPGWSRGDVVAIDAAHGRITLKHGPIKTRRIVMDAMTMPFRAADAPALAPLKRGDRVRFELDLIDDEPVITRIEVVK